MAGRNLIEELKQRGLIAQLTDEQGLIDRLEQGPIALYCGFDPTADSLHLGHLVPLLCLRRFQALGHQPVALVGGATGLIGDPSFKATERKLNTTQTVAEWADKIRRQLEPFLCFTGDNPAIIANNYAWFAEMNVLDFLREVGKHFSVNQMINREAVKQRLQREDQGISYTEFSYNLLQSYDFVCLNQRYRVELQLGGSDQWGNIVTGIDLTRRIQQTPTWGLTVPLITKSDGTKFGKTETGAIWLDAEKTTPYKFYQFWMNTADEDVYRFLQFFTFIPLKAIEEIRQQDATSGEPPRAQQILAEEVTRLVHGDSGVAAAKRITKSLFAGNLENMQESDFAQLAQDGMPKITPTAVGDLQQALVDAKLAPSRGQAKALISANAITVNGTRQNETDYAFTPQDKLCGRYTLLRRGKKHYCLLCWPLPTQEQT